MNSRIQQLLEDIKELEKNVLEELEREKKELGYQIQRGKVTFEKEILSQHTHLARSIRDYLRHARLRAFASSPLVYTLIFPLILLDAFASLYHFVCFRVYGIPLVVRREFLIFDRHQLRYLNAIERFHCFYCSYANGVLAYASEIGARTEQFWCPIKHSRKTTTVHSRYHLFFPYGDAEQYHSRFQQLRRQFHDLSKPD